MISSPADIAPRPRSGATVANHRQRIEQPCRGDKRQQNLNAVSRLDGHDVGAIGAL
jgi:hypothetical protein